MGGERKSRERSSGRYFPVRQGGQQSARTGETGNRGRSGVSFPVRQVRGSGGSFDKGKGKICEKAGYHEHRSFSVFVDGLGQRVTENQLNGAFSKIGRVVETEILKRRRGDIRFNFGFVHYSNDAEAWQAIRKLNGIRFEGHYIHVRKAWYNRPPRKGGSKRSSINYAIRGRVWRPKKMEPQTGEERKKDIQRNTTVRLGEGEEAGMRYTTRMEGKQWVARCAIAQAAVGYNVNLLQEYYSSIGLFNFRFIPLGATEVVMEFENQEEMETTITDCREFLEHKLSGIRPCDIFTNGASQLIWVVLWQVPLGAWNLELFRSVGNRLGRFIRADEATLNRERVDMARILVEVNHPLWHPCALEMEVDGQRRIILAEKELLQFDYGCVSCRPSTPVKEYSTPTHDSDQEEDETERYRMLFEDDNWGQWERSPAADDEQRPGGEEMEKGNGSNNDDQMADVVEPLWNHETVTMIEGYVPDKHLGTKTEDNLVENDVVAQVCDLLDSGYSWEELASIQKFKNLIIKQLEIFAGSGDDSNRIMTWSKWKNCNYGTTIKIVNGGPKFIVGNDCRFQQINSVKAFWALPTEKPRGNEGLKTAIVWGQINSVHVGELVKAIDDGPQFESHENQSLNNDDDQDEPLIQNQVGHQEFYADIEEELIAKKSRGKPRKKEQKTLTITPTRRRGRPRKNENNQGVEKEQREEIQWQLIHADTNGEDGIMTRARRALIRSMNAGLIFECDEEVALQGLVNQIKQGLRQ